AGQIEEGNAALVEHRERPVEAFGRHVHMAARREWRRRHEEHRLALEERFELRADAVVHPSHRATVRSPTLAGQAVSGRRAGRSRRVSAESTEVIAPGRSATPDEGRTIVPTYVMLSTLTAEGGQTLHAHPD